MPRQVTIRRFHACVLQFHVCARNSTLLLLSFYAALPLSPYSDPESETGVSWGGFFPTICRARCTIPHDGRRGVDMTGYRGHVYGARVRIWFTVKCATEIMIIAVAIVHFADGTACWLCLKCGMSLSVENLITESLGDRIKWTKGSPRTANERTETGLVVYDAYI